MSVSPLFCYFLTEIRQIWGYDTLVHLFLLCLAELTYWLLSFCVLVLTMKPLILLPFGCLGVSFWDLLVLLWIWNSQDILKDRLSLYANIIAYILIHSFSKMLPHLNYFFPIAHPGFSYFVHLRFEPLG